MKLNILNDPAVTVFMTAIIIVLSVLLIFLLIRSVRRERVDFTDRKAGDKFDYQGMLNFIEKRIATAGRGTAFTLMQMDIHDHKSVKENFGDIQYGNLLIEISEKLTALLPEHTKISHTDKIFLIYLKNEYSPKQVNLLASLILTEMQKPFTLVGALKIEIDINICSASYPESGKTYEEFLNSLQLAMIVSKRKGLNNFISYNKTLSNEDTEEYRYYKEIKEAIENKDFTLYYQPVVDLTTQEVYAAESLLRWNHKTLGVLPPSNFLDIIEQSGDIYWVGLWAFEQLLKHRLALSKMTKGNIMLTMNLSAKQLMHPELAPEFRRLLAKHRARPSDFCMEIVEFAVFGKVDIIHENIQKLRQIGFKIALDNYGLELSSLSNLNKLPLDMIKIDKAFLAQAEENAMVTNIVEMLIKYASEEDVKIVAEGIENAEIFRRMKKFGVSYGQGYHFSMPKPLTDFITDANTLPWNE